LAVAAKENTAAVLNESGNAAVQKAVSFNGISFLK
jgi:hypothetical protein